MLVPIFSNLDVICLADVTLSSVLILGQIGVDHITASFLPNHHGSCHYAFLWDVAISPIDHTWWPVSIVQGPITVPRIVKGSFLAAVTTLRESAPYHCIYAHLWGSPTHLRRHNLGCETFHYMAICDIWLPTYIANFLIQ